MSACKVSSSPLVRKTNIRGYRQTSAIALLRVEERRSCHKEETAATPCLGLVHTGKEEGTRNFIWRRATQISATTLFMKAMKAEGNDDEQVRCDETDEKASTRVCIFP